jgi:hypothetical protein
MLNYELDASWFNFETLMHMVARSGLVGVWALRARMKAESWLGASNTAGTWFLPLPHAKKLAQLNLRPSWRADQSRNWVGPAAGQRHGAAAFDRISLYKLRLVSSSSSRRSPLQRRKRSLLPRTMRLAGATARNQERTSTSVQSDAAAEPRYSRQCGGSGSRYRK